MSVQKQYLVTVDTTQPVGQAVQVVDISSAPVTAPPSAVPVAENDGPWNALAALSDAISGELLGAIRNS